MIFQINCDCIKYVGGKRLYVSPMFVKNDPTKGKVSPLFLGGRVHFPFVHNKNISDPKPGRNILELIHRVGMINRVVETVIGFGAFRAPVRFCSLRSHFCASEANKKNGPKSKIRGVHRFVSTDLCRQIRVDRFVATHTAHRKKKVRNPKSGYIAV